MSLQKQKFSEFNKIKRKFSEFSLFFLLSLKKRVFLRQERVNFYWDKIGPSILRSHVNERLYCECSTMTRLKRLRDKYQKLFMLL